MKKLPYVGAGIFVVSALILFGLCIFMIGNQKNAFHRHVDFYTEIADVNGLAPGSLVRVSGFDAGQVDSIEVPGQPSGKFRIKLHLDEKLHKLIRDNSIVSVESDGVVGDKFLQIDGGTNQSQEAEAGTTLLSKEPIELSAVIANATGLMDEAKSTIVEVKGKLEVALDSATTTINNANGLVSDARHGNGPIGVMLNDKETAAKLKQTITNAQQASANLSQVTLHAGQVMTDIQSRNFPAKADDSLANAHHAVQQLDQASQQLNQASVKVNDTLTEALGPDRSGDDAATNVRETLSNVNLATANMADDTEALKHEFLFRGYFKKRGYYSLTDLTPEQYRGSRYFDDPHADRSWLSAEGFTTNATGKEVLSEIGQMQVDHVIGAHKSIAAGQPIVIEGYSTQSSPSNEMIQSRTRAELVAHYIEKRFQISAKNVGEVALNSTPPPASGKSVWNGICIVFVVSKK